MKAKTKASTEFPKTAAEELAYIQAHVVKPGGSIERINDLDKNAIAYKVDGIIRPAMAYHWNPINREYYEHIKAADRIHKNVTTVTTDKGKIVAYKWGGKEHTAVAGTMSKAEAIEKWPNPYPFETRGIAEPIVRGVELGGITGLIGTPARDTSARRDASYRGCRVLLEEQLRRQR